LLVIPLSYYVVEHRRLAHSTTRGLKGEL